MHAWDEPAETLLALGPKRGVPLVMPRLGEPVEPAHFERVDPWWRSVKRDEHRRVPVEAPEPAIPANVPLPLD
jgi:hypothetical protein